MIDFYPEFSNLCAESIKNGNKMEQLTRYRVVTWPSTLPSGLQRVQCATMMSIRQRSMWCRSAQMSTPTETCVISRSFWRRRGTDICRLLFLGVDWHRKGGDIALAVAELLNQKGIRTELDIVGCNTPRIYQPLQDATVSSQRRQKKAGIV